MVPSKRCPLPGPIGFIPPGPPIDVDPSAIKQ